MLAVAPWQSLDGGTRSEQLSAQKDAPLERRFLQSTEGFLGTRYQLSPLGEGEGKDTDPLLRYDAVDCLTMVEEAMALSLSSRDDEVLPTLSRIRYEAEPSYAGRLHVMESQWLPVNVKRGLLRDVTKSLGGGATKTVSKRITEATWAEKGGASLGLPKSAQLTGEFFIDIVPSDRAPAVLAAAPEGLVVVVVRADRPRLVSRITHVGVLVQKPQGTFLRHASRSFKRVVDEPIEKYLQRNLEFGAWTVEGVALFQVNDPGWNHVPDAGTPEPIDAGVVELIDAGVPVVQQPKPTSCGCTSTFAWPAVVALALLLRRR